MKQGSIIRRTFTATKDFVIWLISLRWIRDLWLYIVRLVERMDDDHIFLSSSGVAFSALLCLIPIVLLAFYIVGLYVESEKAAQTINTYIDQLRLFPFQREKLRVEIFRTLEEFSSAKSIAGIVGAIGLVWSATALFSSIRGVFNRIFRIVRTRNIFLSKAKDLLTLSIIGVMFIIAMVFSYGVSIIQNIGHSFLGDSYQYSLLTGTVSYGMSVLLTAIAFLLLFIFLPDRRLPTKAVLLSTVIATVLWEVAKQGFAYYISNFWSIGRIYGPYSFLIATTLWIYYSSLTLIVSAEIGEMYIERRYLRRLFHPDRMMHIRKGLRAVGLTQNGDATD